MIQEVPEKYLTWNIEPKLEHPKNITVVAYNRIFFEFPMKKKIINVSQMMPFSKSF